MSTTEDQDPSVDVDDIGDDGSATTIVVIVGGVVVLSAFIGIIVFCSCLGAGEAAASSKAPAKAKAAAAAAKEKGGIPSSIWTAPLVIRSFFFCRRETTEGGPFHLHVLCIPITRAETWDAGPSV